MMRNQYCGTCLKTQSFREEAAALVCPVCSRQLLLHAGARRPEAEPVPPRQRRPSRRTTRRIVNPALAG